MEIEVSVSSDGWSKDLTEVETLVRDAANAALIRCAPKLADRDGEVAITLSGDDELRALNRQHRGQDKATNVLSFPMLDGDGPQVGEVDLLLGDIVIAHGVTAREAVEGNKKISDHLSHLVVHGVLHLLGYDHEENEDAEKMETLEVEILRTLNIADPYR